MTRHTSEPIDLGSQKHLFIDFSLVDQVDDVTLRVQPPRVGGVAIHRDRAWEHHLHWTNTVIDDDGLARLWYSSSHMGARNLNTSRWGYAESLDGIHWHKPNLGLVELNRVTANNLIPDPAGSVFKDPTAPPEERYKGFLLNRGRDAGPTGFGLFTSADGLRFRRKGGNGVELIGDTQNQAFWDERIGRYVAYFRNWVPTGRDEEWLGNVGPWRRAVARWETDDLTSRDGWQLTDSPVRKRGTALLTSELPTVLALDDLDPPDMDIYTPSIVKYPGSDDVYISTFSAYKHFTEAEILDAEPRENDGLMEIQLAVSRDGITWDRPDRRPYVCIEPDGPRSQMIYSALGMVIRGHTIYQYGTAYDQSHGLKRTNNPGGQIIWTEQRLDGFVSAEAAYGGGELITKPVVFSGNRLELNIDASASGEARVELQDAEGRAIEGYTLDACDRVLGNHIRRVVTWHGDSRLPATAGQPLRLRIVMRGARLYALQFVTA